MELRFRAEIARQGDDRRIIIIPKEYLGDAEAFVGRLLNVVLSTIDEGQETVGKID